MKKSILFTIIIEITVLCCLIAALGIAVAQDSKKPHNGTSSSNATQYAPGENPNEMIVLYDILGNTVPVKRSESGKLLSEGWYEEPVCYIYSADGAEPIIIEQSRKAMYLLEHPECSDKEVIWLYSPEPNVEKRLAPKDGLDIVAENESGWYAVPVCYVYSAQGSIIIPTEQLAQKLSEGWSEVPI